MVTVTSTARAECSGVTVVIVVAFTTTTLVAAAAPTVIALVRSGWSR